MATLSPLLSKEIIAEVAKDIARTNAAARTLERMGYTWEGGELWKPPLGPRPDFAAWDKARRQGSRGRVARTAAALVAVALLGYVLGAAFAARAHQAPSGWAYDTDCCSHHDCAPVPEGAIRARSDGWHIHLPPGSHPMLRADGPGLDARIGYADPRARISGDRHWHACVSPAGKLLCIYTLPGGV